MNAIEMKDARARYQILVMAHDKLKSALQAKESEMLALAIECSGVKVGDIVRSTSRYILGKRGKVVEIAPLVANRPEFLGKQPWVSVYPQLKSGAWSWATHNWYDTWEAIDVADSEGVDGPDAASD